MGALRDAVAIRRINVMRERSARAQAARAAQGGPECQCLGCVMKRQLAAQAEAQEPAPVAAPGTKAH